MRHTKVSALDMQRLASTPAAFHQAAVHSFDNRGCTCADQWICAECGTWHRCLRKESTQFILYRTSDGKLNTVPVPGTRVHKSVPGFVYRVRYLVPGTRVPGLGSE